MGIHWFSLVQVRIEEDKVIIHLWNGMGYVHHNRERSEFNWYEMGAGLDGGAGERIIITEPVLFSQADI